MIVLPFPPASLSGHAKGNSHWGKSGVTKQWRKMASDAARQAGIDAPLAGDIAVHILFVPKDRRGDRVNFPNRCKPVLDGIADALGVNDSRFVPHYSFAEPQAPGRLEISIGAAPRTPMHDALLQVILRCIEGCDDPSERKERILIARADGHLTDDETTALIRAWGLEAA